MFSLVLCFININIAVHCQSVYGFQATPSAAFLSDVDAVVGTAVSRSARNNHKNLANCCGFTSAAVNHSSPLLLFELAGVFFRFTRGYFPMNPFLQVLSGNGH